LAARLTSQCSPRAQRKPRAWLYVAWPWLMQIMATVHDQEGGETDKGL
jgi:hypothetical protein